MTTEIENLKIEIAALKDLHVLEMVNAQRKAAEHIEKLLKHARHTKQKLEAMTHILLDLTEDIDIALEVEDVSSRPVARQDSTSEYPAVHASMRIHLLRNDLVYALERTRIRTAALQKAFPVAEDPPGVTVQGNGG